MVIKWSSNVVMIVMITITTYHDTTTIMVLIVRITIIIMLILAFQGLRGAQPDGLNAEYCVAVLNDIYQVII